MLFQRKKIIFSLVLIISLMLTGCGVNSQNEANPEPESVETFTEQEKNLASEASDLERKIDLINSKNKKVGTAILSQVKHGVLLKIYANGLEPGRHGFHIHETGKCEAPTFESAGGHFNPMNKEHGFNNNAGYHAGDMANLVVNKKGEVEAEVFLNYVSLTEGADNSLLDDDGSSLMIHSGPDDHITDPAGNAGDRIVCGVIQ